MNDRTVDAVAVVAVIMEIIIQMTRWNMQLLQELFLMQKAILLKAQQ